MSHDSIPPELPKQDPKRKYRRFIYPLPDEGGSPIVVDVYCVLDAFGEPPSAVAHAIKKLLCAGVRGKASWEQDISEAIIALERALQLERQKRQ